MQAVAGHGLIGTRDNRNSGAMQGSDDPQFLLEHLVCDFGALRRRLYVGELLGQFWSDLVLRLARSWLAVWQSSQ